MLGKNIRILTDECNEEVLLMASAASGLNGRFNSGRFALESFPSQIKFDKSDALRLKEIADWCHCAVAIERPGPAADGSYKTMRGLIMDPFVAPLEDLIGVYMFVLFVHKVYRLFQDESYHLAVDSYDHIIMIHESFMTT